MNINAKRLTVPVSPRPFNGLWLSIAAVLRWVNGDYDDYDNRMDRGELTKDEARAEILGDIANHKKHMEDAIFWGGG